MERAQRTAICAAVIILSLSTPLLAQTFTGLSVIDDISTALMSVGKKTVNTVFVVSGVVAAFALIPAGIKAYRGEPGSKEAIVNVGIGAVVIFAILGVIKMVMHF